MNEPLLSKLTLAIPVYNDVRHFRKTLESCVAQAGQVWLYDNCSTDGSSEIAAEFAQNYSHVKHVRHPENLGAVENFRLPLFACDTEYFIWIGAHDILSNGYTLPLLNALEADPTAALAVTDIQHIDEDDQHLKKFTRFSDWRHDIGSDDVLTRMQAFINDHFGDRHDSLLLHGVFRTSLLKKAWVGPCIAQDDAILTRTIALGKILYAQGGTIYARRFTTSRSKGKTEAERSASTLTISSTPVERSRREATLAIMEMAIHVTTKTKDLPKLFRVLTQIGAMVVKPSKARRKRKMKRIAVWVAAIATAVLFLSELLSR